MKVRRPPPRPSPQPSARRTCKWRSNPNTSRCLSMLLAKMEHSRIPSSTLALTLPTASSITMARVAIPTPTTSASGKKNKVMSDPTLPIPQRWTISSWPWRAIITCSVYNNRIRIYSLAFPQITNSFQRIYKREPTCLWKASAPRSCQNSPAREVQCPLVKNLT